MSNVTATATSIPEPIARRRVISADALVVELDGVLVRGSLLLELIIKWLKRPSLAALLLPLWILRGRGILARELAARVEPDCSSLALDQTVLAHLKAERAQGRRLYLVTDAPTSWADKIAGDLGLFDGVVERDDVQQRTRDAADRSASSADAVADGKPRLRRDRSATAWSIPPLAVYLRAMRVHQWLKNVLLFVPLTAALHFTDMSAILQLCVAFIAFGLCASSVYLLNDLADLDDDRRHATKCNRPFASGELPISHGLFLIPGLLVTSVLLSMTLPKWFGVSLFAYYVMTLAYTFFLKRREAIDVVTLALLYTTRIFAGGAVTGITLSVWLLTFSTFIFLSLALAKRCAELFQLRAEGGVATAGRGYFVSDLPVLFGMGIGSSYVGALVLALYLVSPQVQLGYDHPRLLWAFVPALIYWATRLWLKTGRGEMDEDPVVFTARDPVSLGVAAVCGVAIWLAM